MRPALAKEGTESRPVLLLEYIEGQSLAALIGAGSCDVDQKLQLAVNITQALARVHDRQVIHKDLSSAKDVMADLMEGPKPASEDDELWSKLTVREREALQLVAEGRNMTEIAEILYISSRTVERHKYNLMDKLKLRTTAELTRYVIKRGLIPPP